MLSAASSLTTGKGHESHENTKVTKKNFSWLGQFQQRLAGKSPGAIESTKRKRIPFRVFRVFVVFVVYAASSRPSR